MLKGQKFEIKRVGNQGLNIQSFLKPQDGGIDTFEFILSGQADNKFLTKLSKLIQSETKGKSDGAEDTR